MAVTGSITLTEPATTQHELYSVSPVVRITLDWTSSAGGLGTVTDIPTALKYSGTPLAIVYVPDSGGTIPTAAYDVLLYDANGVDIAGGTGANLSETVHVHSAQTLFAPLVDSAITLDVDNAGVSNGGLIYIYLRLERP